MRSLLTSDKNRILLDTARIYPLSGQFGLGQPGYTQVGPWMVHRPTGEVMLSIRGATQENIRLAREMGFSIM